MAKLPLTSLSAKATVGVVATVLLIGGGSFWVLQSYYRQQMIESLAASTTVQGALIEESLRHAMHTRSLDLLAEMIRRLASQRGVENVMILDKNGVIRFASDPTLKGRTLDRSDPTCAICHQYAPSVRGRTVTFEADQDRRVFRNVNPILNTESCWACHSPANRVNGVLIVDYTMDSIESSLKASSRKMWLSAVTLSIAITIVIVILMRRLVLRRLHRLVQVVDSIETGHLEEHSNPGNGGDEISVLNRHVERMARRLERSMSSLRQRETFLDAVINSADDAILVVDDRLHVVAANRAFQVLSGATARNLIDSRCNDNPLCKSRPIQECPALSALRTGCYERCMRSILRNDGHTCYYEISHSPLRNVGGRPQVIEIWRDITQRREMEAHLANTERLVSLGLLASGISHEINNPLASITTCLDGLRRRVRDGRGRQPDDLKEYLELIRGEVARCCDLTARLKFLGQKPRGIPQPVDLGVLVRDTLALVRYEAEKNFVQVEHRVERDLPVILADEAQLRQLTLNLVLNAIQAVHAPGWLRVSVYRGQNGTTLEVSDSGRGIPREDLPRIFEPFFSTRPDGRGTGLGLFICRVIIEQLGGSIDVASTLGKGTCFTVFIPDTAACNVEVRS